MSRARDVVEVIVKALVDAPEAVVVTETEHRSDVRVDVNVPDEDLGRLIGRQGRTASAIRTLATAAVEADGVRVDVEFRDPQRRR